MSCSKRLYGAANVAPYIETEVADSIATHPKLNGFRLPKLLILKTSVVWSRNGLMGLFRDRVLRFDTDAARHYGELAVTARTGGRGVPTPGVLVINLWVEPDRG